ncbi:Uncharacterized conserved protein YbgA, DUF1722 family [Alteromonadaceae bacterium Bs31]|nr:Uncharacterized conserved protein YbgA, DUF1722 family [Alteromonadaceae bacterium Bs31]
MTEKLAIGVSACLLGEKVRFDGGHNHQALLTERLSEFFEFRSFCPEMSIGMGVPREKIRRVLEGSGENYSSRVETASSPFVDITPKLYSCAEHQQQWLAELRGYLFKKDSPSCGMEQTKAYLNQHLVQHGAGAFAEKVMENNPLLPCEEEGRLGDALLRENFIGRVYVYHRWKNLLHQGLSPKALIDFHSRHKYILMSHSQRHYRALGKLLSNIPKQALQTFSDKYIAQLMAALKIPATRNNHINVLQHIQGYLRPHLGNEDKLAMVKAIEDCRLGQSPLTIPREMLRHYFRKFPHAYISNSYYLSPYPDELIF